MSDLFCQQTGWFHRPEIQTVMSATSELIRFRLKGLWWITKGQEWFVLEDTLTHCWYWCVDSDTSLNIWTTTWFTVWTFKSNVRMKIWLKVRQDLVQIKVCLQDEVFHWGPTRCSATTGSGCEYFIIWTWSGLTTTTTKQPNPQWLTEFRVFPGLERAFRAQRCRRQNNGFKCVRSDLNIYDLRLWQDKAAAQHGLWYQKSS